uniref:Uncharacterized protein n=1 Tax=Branchiostoma floridae TaxID=7739 RepID=C3ZL21_BRAFL|eukprot:XP_002590692.1 hypothetical protein BRAFLDRAFT_89494 [Branchiostoma floridae]
MQFCGKTNRMCCGVRTPGEVELNLDVYAGSTVDILAGSQWEVGGRVLVVSGEGVGGLRGENSLRNTCQVRENVTDLPPVSAWRLHQTWLRHGLPPRVRFVLAFGIDGCNERSFLGSGGIPRRADSLGAKKCPGRDRALNGPSWSGCCVSRRSGAPPARRDVIIKRPSCTAAQPPPTPSPAKTQPGVPAPSLHSFIPSVWLRESRLFSTRLEPRSGGNHVTWPGWEAAVPAASCRVVPANFRDGPGPGGDPDNPRPAGSAFPAHSARVKTQPPLM